MSIYDELWFGNKVGNNIKKIIFMEDHDDRFKELWLYNRL